MALVIGSDETNTRQLIEKLSATRFFDRVKPLKTIDALYKYLRTKPMAIICWAMENNDPEADWISKLRQQDQWHDLPLIAFSRNQQNLHKGFNFDVTDTMHITTEPVELKARLRCHLSRWQRLCELRQDKEQLQKMALTDPLTGLGNRATFDTSMNHAIAQRNRFGEDFSLLLIDLDHFKKFNDTFGHQVGDQVLKQVAEAIKSASRATDICCRYGGEEFAVVLPKTDATNAKVLASRIHKNVANLSGGFWKSPMQVTVSIGISLSLIHI